MANGTLSPMDHQIVDNFVASDYEDGRIFVPTDDNQTVPLTFVYKKGLFDPNNIKVLIEL